MKVHCGYFAASQCRSCADIEIPYAEQLEAKQHTLRLALASWPELEWLTPAASAPSAFRNKAKMAVSGTIEAPLLGIADAAGRAVDLRECLLYPEALRASFAPIRRFIGSARLAPYDIVKRNGELKFVLLTVAEDSGDLMLRFVLRSREALGRIQRHLPLLLAELPALKVVSVNLQPLPAAIVEGEEEILLTSEQHLTLVINDHRLWLRPRAFFQTNPSMAAALYRQAADWVDEIAPSRVWDLFCGVGGFALHCAGAGRHVVGVELSREAVEAAEGAASDRPDAAGGTLRFEVADASGVRFPVVDGPELLIVNPPRRGLGEALCAQIDQSTVRWLIYSSCNAASLASDLRRLSGLTPRKARLMDMFPHTPHAETLLLLERTGDRDEPSGLLGLNSARP